MAMQRSALGVNTFSAIYAKLPVKADSSGTMANIAVCARSPDNLDLFYTDYQGYVKTAFWSSSNGWDADWPVGDGFPLGGSIAAVSRKPGWIDLFAVKNDGKLYSRFWDEAAGWSPDWFSLHNSALFNPGAPVAATARDSNHLDVFVVGQDGKLYTLWWTEGIQYWGAPVAANGFPVIGGKYPSNGYVSAVARSPTNLDVFVIGEDGQVLTTWWFDGKTMWGDETQANEGMPVKLGGSFAPGGPIAAVARTSHNLDLFVTGQDGRPMTKWWNDDGWGPAGKDWLYIGGAFPANAPLAAASRGPGNLDVFGVASDRAIWTTWLAPGANVWGIEGKYWHRIGGNLAPGQFLAAISRHADQLDVFGLEDGKRADSCWWNPSAGWSIVFPLLRRPANPTPPPKPPALPAGPNEVSFTADIPSGGLAALGGWVKVTIRRDGTSVFAGHAHDSGADTYSFSLRAELTRSDNPPIGNTMVWTASGEVNGTVDLLFGGGSRDNDWNRLYGKDDRLGNNFEAFRTGRFQLYTDYSSMFSHILSDGINDAKYIWPVIAAL